MGLLRDVFQYLLLETTTDLRKVRQLVTVVLTRFLLLAAECSEDSKTGTLVQGCIC